ncbi:MAG: hypothetical protein KDE56_27625, partial [Anaerolineales bacterium]|nr:hypothetical protein [Anaerolineales bacterium]
IWRGGYASPDPPSEQDESAYRITFTPPPEEPPVPPTEAEIETAVPHWRKPVATGLLGLATGLLLGFLRNLRGGESEKSEVKSEE